MLHAQTDTYTGPLKIFCQDLQEAKSIRKTTVYCSAPHAAQQYTSRQSESLYAPSPTQEFTLNFPRGFIMKAIMKHSKVRAQTAFLNTYFLIWMLPRKFHFKEIFSGCACSQVELTFQQSNNLIYHILTTALNVRRLDFLIILTILLASKKRVLCETMSRKENDTYIMLSDFQAILFLLF